MNPRLEAALKKKQAAGQTPSHGHMHGHGHRLACWSPLASRDVMWWDEREATVKTDAQAVSVGDAMTKLEEVRVALEKATSTRKKLADLEDRLAILETRRPTVLVTTMRSLACSDVEVVKPITVTIEADGDAFIASFMDAGVTGGGDSIPEAFASIQEMVAASFRTLVNMSESSLGPKMLRQKHVLLEFLCLRSQKSTPKSSQPS